MSTETETGRNELALDLAARLDAVASAPTSDPLGIPPGPDEIAGPPPGASPAFNGGATSGAPPTTPAQAVGRPVPTQASQVARAQETLRIFKQNEFGKQSLISDYTIQEISAGGGDLPGFIQRVLAPRFKGGDYVIYKVDRAGLTLYQTVSIANPEAPPVTQPAPSVAAPAAPPVNAAAAFTEAIDLGERLRRSALAEADAADKRAREAAAAEAARVKSEEDRMLARLNESRPAQAAPGMDPVMQMLLMKMLREPAAPQPQQTAAPSAEILGALGQIADRLNRVEALASMPPPPPFMPLPEPPKVSAMEIVTAVTTGLGAILTPAVAAWQSSQTNAMTPEKWANLLVTAVPALATLGLIGGPKVGPTDVALAGLQAKLDILTSGETPDALDQLVKMTTIIEALRPKQDGADSVIRLLDHTVDKLPEITDSIGKLISARGVSEADAGKLIEGPAGVKVPEAMLKLRRDVLAVKDTDMPSRGKKIIPYVINALMEMAKLGKPWDAECQAMFAALKIEDVETIKTTLAKMVGRCWPKTDPKRREFYQAVIAVVAKYATELATWANGGKTKTEAPDETDTDDLDTDDGADLEDPPAAAPAARKAPPAAPVAPPPAAQPAAAPQAHAAQPAPVAPAPAASAAPTPPKVAARKGRPPKAAARERELVPVNPEPA